MGLEESHDRSHQVPCQIDGSQEDDRTNGNLVGEQHLDIVSQSSFLAFRLRKLSTLLQLTLQIPGYEGNDEQSEEYDTRREDIDSLLRHVSTSKEMCYGLYPTKEVAARGKEHAKQEDAHGSEAP